MSYFFVIIEREKDFRIHAKRIKRLIFRPNDPIECNLNGEGKWYHGIIIKYREEEDRTYDVAFSDSDETLPSTVEKIPGKWLRSKGDSPFSFSEPESLGQLSTNNFFGDRLSCVYILLGLLIGMLDVPCVVKMPVYSKSRSNNPSLYHNLT